MHPFQTTHALHKDITTTERTVVVVDDCSCIDSMSSSSYDDNDNVDDNELVWRVVSQDDQDDDDDDDDCCSTGPTRKMVRFDHVTVREHAITVGDHPLCTDSLPLTLDWEFWDHDQQYPIDVYEDVREFQGRGSCSLNRLSFWKRRQLLRWVGGWTDQDLREQQQHQQQQSPSHRLPPRLETPLVDPKADPPRMELERLDDCSSVANSNGMLSFGFPAQMLQIQILEN